jgi:hypothetical protein
LSNYSLGDIAHPWAITEEELKRFHGFADISEEESKLVRETLVRLAIIAMEIN